MGSSLLPAFTLDAPCAPVRASVSHLVTKGGLPLLLPLALTFWAAAAGVYSLAGESYSAQGELPLQLQLLFEMPILVGVAVLAFVIAIAGFVFTQKKTLFIGVIGILMGAACGALGAQALMADTDFATADARTWHFELLEDTSAGSFGSSAKAQARDESGRSVCVRVNFTEGDVLYCGARFEATTQMSAPPTQSRTFFWQSAMCAQARLSKVTLLEGEGIASLIYGIRQRAIGLLADFGGQQSGILQALVCGYRAPIKEEGVYNQYKTVGLAHVVAVSGAHLAITTMMLGALLRVLRAPRTLFLLLSGCFVVFYVLFSGVPLSAVRAAFMVLLALCAQGMGRRAMSLNALALCILSFIALSPPVAVSVSFFLSAASTLGIVLFAGLIASWFDGLPKRIQSCMGEPLALTLASNIATLPFSAALFSQLPLIAPLSNIVATPLFSLGCVAGLVACIGGCMLPALAPFLVGAASLAVWPLTFAVDMCSHIPFASIAVSLPVVPMLAFSVVLALALWIAWPRFTLRMVGFGVGVIALSVTILLFVTPLFHDDEIIMLDVGQGDAFVIRSKGTTVLVDTGNQDTLLREALARAGIYRLDAVVISHADDDHCGSLDELAAVAKPARIYVASDALRCACKNCEGLRTRAANIAGQEGVQGLQVGDSIALGNFTLRVIWPRAFSDAGGNADSLSMLATLDYNGDDIPDWTTLFCGDAESSEIGEMIESGLVGDIDVLKVPHHGSKAGLSDELMATLKPELALISVGARNRYGHPKPETLNRLQSFNARIERTDQSGDVNVSFSPACIYVRRAVE